MEATKIDAEQLASAIDLATFYAAARVSICYWLWHDRRRRKRPRTWWRGVGVLPASLATFGSVAGLLWGYAALHRAAAPLPCSFSGSCTVSILLGALMTLALIGLLLPYWIGAGMTVRGAWMEYGKIAGACVTIFAVAIYTVPAT